MKKLILAAAIAALPLSVWAQASSSTTTTSTSTSTATSTSSTSTTVPANKLTDRYTDLAGSEKNAKSLVTGLRDSSKVTLTDGKTTTTFDPPTKKMGYGNINIALAIAEKSLADAGITNPTTDQLKTALMGGEIKTRTGTVKMEGVLQMRADGMGWGQIAHEIGVHPGLGRPVTTASSAPAASPGGSGITNAAGASAFSRGNGQGRALGAGQKPSQGATVTSAAGSAAGGGLGIVKGGGNGNGNAFGHAK